MHVVYAVQDDAEQVMPGTGSGEHQASPCLGGKTSLDAGRACVSPEQYVRIIPRVTVVRYGSGKLVVRCANNLSEEWNAHGVACQAYEVVSRRVVVQVYLTVRVYNSKPIGIKIVCLK